MTRARSPAHHAHCTLQPGFFAAKAVSTAPPATQAPSFSTTVHIKDVSHLTLLRPDRLAPFLGTAPLDIAREAVAQTFAMRDLFLAKVWTTVLCLLEGAGGTEGDQARHLETLFAERLLPEV